MEVLSVKHLHKSFRQHFWTKNRKVLDDVSFSVNKGEVFGFLGPNGAGKSTSIKIILGILRADEGEAYLLGEKIGSREAKRRIGFLPENPYFYDYLTATQFLEFHGSLCGMQPAYLKKRISEVLALVGMRGTENMKLRSFSKGMLQRIGLAQAIVHDPDLVILDEPMTGLDPIGRKEVRDIMLALKAAGKTVFFSTHILGDVEAICDRVTIMHLGKIVSSGSLRELVPLESQYAEVLWINHPELEKWGRSRAFECQVRSGYLNFQVRPKSNESQLEFETRLSQEVEAGLKMGGVLQSVTHRQANLEDLFVRHVGEMKSRV